MEECVANVVCGMRFFRVEPGSIGMPGGSEESFAMEKTCLGEKSGSRFARMSRISKSRYGTPGPTILAESLDG